MEQDRSFLTEKQQTALLLREEGLSFQKIAERMGVTANAARQHVRRGEQRLREYARYHDVRQQNDQPVDFPLTRGELKAVLLGLTLLKEETLRTAGANSAGPNREERLPYELQVIDGLLDRVQAALCHPSSPEQS